MPITSSAKKALRQSLKRREHNREWKDRLHQAIKKAATSKTQETLSAAYKIIDKSAKKGIIAKNKAARLKSQLVKRK